MTREREERARAAMERSQDMQRKLCEIAAELAEHTAALLRAIEAERHTAPNPHVERVEDDRAL